MKMIESSKYAIIARNVSFDYGNQWKKSLSLNSVCMNVEKGEVYGLLGPSGSGKTTLIKLIIGLRQPNSGHISVFGYNAGSVECGTPGIGVGYMPQEISLPSLMTISEVFKYFGNLYLLDNEYIETKMKYFLKTLNLNNKKALICNLSGGEKRCVSLAIAMFSYPRLLILDEPTVGVDPLLRQTIWSLLTRLTKQFNTTIIVTTHYIEEMRCAKTVAFLRNGEILEEKEPNAAIKHHNCLNLESVFLELCVKQKECTRFVSTKSGNLDGTSSALIKKSYISVKKPINDERNKSAFANESCRIKSVILKSFYYYWRIGGVTTAFIIPLLCISFCVLCIGKNPKDVRIGWIADEKLIKNTSESLTADSTEIPYLPDLLLKSINKKLINIMTYKTVEAALKDAKTMKISGYIHIKDNFSENFYKRDIIIIDDTEKLSNEAIDAGAVHLYLDATNYIFQQLIVREMYETVSKFRKLAFMEIGINENVSSFPFKLAEAIHGTIATEDFTQHTYNSIICFMVLIFFVLSMTEANDCLATDINSDVYSRSHSAGLKPYHLIIGELIVSLIIISSAVVFNFIFLIYVFNVPLRGSLILAAINIALVILCGASLGALIAVFIHSIFFCYIFVAGVSIAIFVVSGTIWPLEAQPYFIKPFQPFIPGILPTTAMLRIFNYEYIDFATYILPAFLSSTFYCIIPGFVTCYFLRKFAF